MENANKKGAGRKPTNHTVASPFAAKLKAVFWDSGLTQSEAAEKLGVSRQTFNNWLNGQNQPDYSYLIRISNLFGVSCDYLLGVSDAKTLDMDISGCCKLTGLSEQAITKLIELKKENRITSYCELISILIEDYNCAYLLSMIGKRISIYKDLKGLQGDELINYRTKNTIKCNGSDIHFPIDNDRLIDAILQTEFIKNLPFIFEAYCERFSDTPSQREKIWDEFSRELLDKEIAGEITAEERKKLIEQWLNGGSNNG